MNQRWWQGNHSPARLGRVFPRERKRADGARLQVAGRPARRRQLSTVDRRLSVRLSISASVTPPPHCSPMTALIKLPDVLPMLVGKTIARTMLVFHGDGRHQLWLFFTDGTSYEVYGRGDISGARRPTETRVEDVFRSATKGGVEVLVAPDRQKERRGTRVLKGDS